MCEVPVEAVREEMAGRARSARSHRAWAQTENDMVARTAAATRRRMGRRLLLLQRDAGPPVGGGRQRCIPACRPAQDHPEVHQVGQV